MASIPGFQFNLSGATGTQALLSPKDGWRAFVLPQGAFASQDSAGTLVTFDSSAIASRFAVGNWIQVGLLTANIRQVGAVGGNSLSVSGAALSITENDRIFLFGNTEPTVSGGSATYTTPNTLVRQRDDTTADLYTNSMITTDSQGLVRGFASPALYDVLIQDGNHTNQGYIADFEVGTVRGVSVTDDAYFGSTVFIASGPSDVRHPNMFLSGSSTLGIQEAINDLRGAPGSVMLSGVTYSCTKKVWVHENVNFIGNGATIKRASGSISNSDATASADVLGFGPYGSDGTNFSSGTIGRNISVIGPLFLDGNQAAFSGLTNTNLGLAGVRGYWVENLTMLNVTAQNTLQDGFYLSNLRNQTLANLRGISVGMWGVTSSRNAISFYNNDDSSVYCNQGVLAGFRFHSVGDEAITLSGTQGLAVAGGTVDGCDFGIEFTGTNTVPIQDCVFSGIAFNNLLDACITLAPFAADVNRCTFGSMTFNCHPTNHSGQLFYMGATGVSYSDIAFSDITATNVNSKDTTNKNWIDIQTGASSNKRGLLFSKIHATGLVGSTRTGDVGVLIQGRLDDVRFSDVTLRDVPGIGIGVDDATGTTMHNLNFTKVTIDGCNYWGAMIRNNLAGASNVIREVYWDGCVMKDTSRYATAIGAGDAAWYIEAGTAGATISNIYWRGCRTVRTTGTSMNYGMYMNHGSGSMDNLYIGADCDFSQPLLGWFRKSGTPTNIHFRPPNGQGTTIATTATITIPPDGSWFQVSGSTAMSGISWNPWDNGRTAKLLFLNGTTMQSPLTGAKIGGTFSIASAYAMTLTGTSGYWNEDSRSANV